MKLIDGSVILYGPRGEVVTTQEDVDDPAIERLHVEADIKPGASIIVVPAIDTGALYREFLSDDGTPTGNDSMIVNGSVTPVEFFVDPHPTKDIQLAELRLLLSAFAIVMDGGSFGKGGGVLPNGVLIEYVDDAAVTELGLLHINEEILMLPVRNDVLFNTASANDVMALSFDLANQVEIHAAHPTDRIRVTIQDDLTAGARGLNYFKFAAFGTLVDP